jgi:hypothetical protein
MRPMILVLLVVAVLFILGIAVHTLLWVGLVALVIWLAAALIRPHGRGRRWFSL